MPYRIETACRSEIRDSTGNSVCRQIRKHLNIPIESVTAISVYIVDLPVNDIEAENIKNDILSDPLIQNSAFNKIDTGEFDWCIEIGFKPGVTDSVGSTAKEAVSDLLGRNFELSEKIYTAKQYRLNVSGLIRKEVQAIGEEFLGNKLIESISVLSYDTWLNTEPVIDPPRIKETTDFNVREFNLNISDEKLMKLSKDNTLSLSIEEMKAMQQYFNKDDVKKKRAAEGAPELITDVEMECLAQTWSEHCKHKIFNSLIHYTENGKTTTINSVFDTYIKESTRLIGKKVPWLLSVFKDNAGVIAFNDRISIVYKVETHNSPSALEPYGGALTGIVGVNRDPMGTGMGAGLLFNVWGYCFGSPFYDKKIPAGLLHPGRIREGVHSGVIDGGNQSGIPYGRGWEFFDDRFIGKPLVFCGTVGYLPAELDGKPSHEKTANPGDVIVMAGGRIGKDGIHGATFSSEELHKDSPIQAVQIGDPITQKKMYDFILEARDAGLYSCITDNGAGGLSSSVGEMAQFSGGCRLDLTKAPLKYDGLDPWEILISEAQERMTLAVPPGLKDKLFDLAEKRGVELTDLGIFTDTGKFHVLYKDRTVAYLDMEFLHDGLPQMELKAEWIPPVNKEPDFDEPEDLNEALTSMLSRLNLCSNEGKSRQYDHEVKGLTVIKPFCGEERDVPTDASVFLVEHGSLEGIVLAEGKNPHYSDIDTYHMAASVIDEAVRRIISAGGSLKHTAGLDNFCWPDPVQSDKTPDGEYKLAQLVRANKALYDYTTAYNVPCISGKDSMKNDCIFDGVKISIPPTLLFSAIAKIENVSKAVTMDVKQPGDLVYVLGETFFELGGSEYYRMIGEKIDGNPIIGNSVPKVNAENAYKLYADVEKAVSAGLVNSIHTPTIGGLAAAFAKTAFAGNFGLSIDLRKTVQSGCTRNDHILFSESNSRFIVTLPPENKEKFENIIKDNVYAEVGITTKETDLLVYGMDGSAVINSRLNKLKTAWKSTLKDFFDGSAKSNSNIG